MNHVQEIEGKLRTIGDFFREEISAIRTNRPTPKIVENIPVDYMGTPMTVKQLATINVEPPRDLVIVPWDKSSLPMIEKAIQDSGTGLSVSNQGSAVRCKLPEMTQERVAELAKLVKSAAESAKIKIRMTRDDVNKSLKEIPNEDERFRTKENVQKAVDAANKNIESLLEAKLKEIQS